MTDRDRGVLSCAQNKWCDERQSCLQAKSSLYLSVHREVSIFFSCLSQGCLIISKEQYSSVFFWLAWRRQHWRCTNISSSTSSLMMGGQRTSLLSHSPLTTLHIKSSSLSVLTVSSLPGGTFSISILHSTSIFIFPSTCSSSLPF